MGHLVPSPTPSQRSLSMIESMIKPVGDHLWQRGTNCGGVSCPGGTSCSAASSPGGPSMVAATRAKTDIPNILIRIRFDFVRRNY